MLMTLKSSKRHPAVASHLLHHELLVLFVSDVSPIKTSAQTAAESHSFSAECFILSFFCDIFLPISNMRVKKVVN